MLLTGDVRLRALPGGALLGGFYYDPYPPRFAANLKEALAGGAHVLIRLHPGVRYPMSDAELLGCVDLEGHVVAVVGYDDERGTFELADPWDIERFGGHDGGLRSVPEIELGLRWVNSTYDKAMFVFPLYVGLAATVLSEDTAIIEATIGLQPPAPQVRCAAVGLQHLHAMISTPSGVTLLGDREQHLAALNSDDQHCFRWPIRVDYRVQGEIRVAVASVAHGNDPYPFSDVVGTVASMDVVHESPTTMVAPMDVVREASTTVEGILSGSPR